MSKIDDYLQEKDGYLYNKETGKPYCNYWTNEPYKEEDIYFQWIGTMVDFVLNNIYKNFLNPLREKEGKCNTMRQKLPVIYRRVFAALWAASEDITVGHLAKLLDMTNSNLTPELNRMEADGYIRREISKVSRRCINVYLTEKGLEVMVEYHYKADGIWGDILRAVLSKEEAKDMFYTMCKLNYYLNRFDEKNKIYYSTSEQFFERNLPGEEFVADYDDIKVEFYPGYQDSINKIREKFLAARRKQE